MKANLIALLILLLFISTSLFAKPIEKTVSIDTGTGILEGTLLTTNNNQAKAVALIIAGSGPTDRNGNGPSMTNNSLKLLAEQLNNHGISSLRYDKRGVGKSANAGLKESDLRFEHYIEDAISWITYLKKLNNFNKIVVIGHSEGSLIGMIASQNKHVDMFVSLAGAGQPIDQIIREQLKAQPPMVLEKSTPILDALLRGKTVEQVPAFLHALFRPSVQPYMISWFKYDPQQQLAKLQKPILIVQGDTDLQVSVNNANKLASANKSAKKVIIQQMNHIFKQAPLDKQSNFQTYNQPNLPIKVELVNAVSEFIQD